MEIKMIKDRFNSVAQKYDEQRKFFIPCFDDYYQTSIPFDKDPEPVAVKIGTGYYQQHWKNKDIACC